MLICESLLLTILLFTCIYVTTTDLKNSIIENKVLIWAAVPGMVINFIYYFVYAPNDVILFLVNLAVLSTISIIFYAHHIWAAGDSKFLILAVFLVPSRLYNMNGMTPVVWILIFIFSIAYIYVIAESIYLGIKEKSLFKVSSIKIDIINFLKQYIYCGVYILLFNQITNKFLTDFATSNASLIVMVDLIIILTVNRVEVLKKIWIVVLALIIDIVLFSFNHFGMQIVDSKIVVMTGIVLILRIISEKYNYREIETDEVKKGMVLSYITVINFSKSKVKGLPTTTTEDIRSRISDEEAKSIRRWKDSKYGKETITIVRKMPFAIFISMGTILFVIMRVFI